MALINGDVSTVRPQPDERDDAFVGGRLAEARPAPRSFATPQPFTAPPSFTAPPHGAAAHTAFTPAAALPRPRILCLQCPVCAQVSERRRWPAWILQLLDAVHIAPYRC